MITGSGKTTLLNTISGRQSAASGQVTLNQRRFNKQLRRRLGFVLQQDLFLSNLTLWETLYVSGRPHDNTRKATCAPNKNIIMSSFESSGDIQKKEGGPDSCFG